MNVQCDRKDQGQSYIVESPSRYGFKAEIRSLPTECDDIWAPLNSVVSPSEVQAADSHHRNDEISESFKKVSGKEIFLLRIVLNSTTIAKLQY